jgi:hypothetical protein
MQGVKVFEIEIWTGIITRFGKSERSQTSVRGEAMAMGHCPRRVVMPNRTINNSMDVYRFKLDTGSTEKDIGLGR